MRLLDIIASRNSCLSYRHQINFTVTHVAMRKVNAFETLYYVLKFFLELITKPVFALAHFLVGENLHILRLKSKNKVSDK